MNRRRVVLLGSTGSIGTQALEVVHAHPDRFEVVGLAAGRDIDTLARQAVDAGTYDSYGEALFNLDLAGGAYSCARCHTQGWSWGNPGVTGAGGFGPSLIGGAANRQFPDEADMIEFIRNGSQFGQQYGIQGQGSGRMPGFGAMLTDEQLRAVVEYVRSL